MDDGTMCQAQSPPPGSVNSGWFPTFSSIGDSISADYKSAKASLQTSYQGLQRGLHSDYEGARCLYQACKLAEGLAFDAILEETGYQLKSLLKGLIPGLLQMIAILGATTFLGAAIGGIVGFFFGGVGAAPGAAVGADLGFDLGMAALTWLGVAFLAVSIAEGFGEMLKALRNGIEWAWYARNLQGAAEDKQVQKAAHELARTVGILVRLILQGILAYLLKKAAMSSTRGAMSTIGRVQAEGAAAVSEATVAELVGRLRASKFGNGFADWVEKNWRDLRDNPKLKPKEAPKLAEEGGGPASAEQPKQGPTKSSSSQSSSDSAAAEEKPDLSTNAKKGVFGEAKADAYMRSKGFRKLNANGKDVQIGDPPQGQGIDGVYENMNPPPQYVVGEAKFGSSKLGSTKDGMQMSRNWIRNRLAKAVGRVRANDIQMQGYDRYLLQVDEAGNVTPSLLTEDSAGNLSKSSIP